MQKLQHPLKQTIINSFFVVVIFFTNTALHLGCEFKLSEFLSLFETIQTTMSVKNRALNYSKLLNAVNLFNPDSDSVKSQVRLYVMLLKVNYLYSTHSHLLKDSATKYQTDDNLLAFEGSEISSEFSMDALVEEDKERFKEDLYNQILTAINLILSKISQLEDEVVHQTLQSLQWPAKPYHNLISKSIQIIKILVESQNVSAK